MRTLVWFRGKDLRVTDHAPLREGARDELLCLFVLDPHYFAGTLAKDAPRHRLQFLLDSLKGLDESLRKRGSELLFVMGPAARALPDCVTRWNVDRVLAHRAVEPAARRRDARLASELSAELILHEGETLLPPGSLRSGSGGPYAVFSPFARSFRGAYASAEPLAAPRTLPSLPAKLDRSRLLPRPTAEELGLTRNPALQSGDERAAHKRLEAFVRGPGAAYDTDRDRMDREGTSRLSADLKFGTLSIRSVYHRAGAMLPEGDARSRFLNELVWREFAHHTLHDRPELLTEPFRQGFEGFPWRDAPRHWQAWCEGRTGYPVVDAAARQLLGEGFVHNRARMISASFLCKHLLISYRRGEAHYLRHLTDGDPAQNNLGWQWSAGCGCDAQPYFRVFNPVSQGKKFDPEGEYVRRWLPELAELPARYVHAPFDAPAEVLREAGVELGANYPEPVVDHGIARERFLETARSHLKK